MNRAELVEAVAAEVGLTKKDVNEVVDAMTSAITNRLARRERVTLVGFGTFQVRQRTAKRGINPFTGARISVPAKDVPRFAPGKSLREAVT